MKPVVVHPFVARDVQMKEVAYESKKLKEGYAPAETKHVYVGSISDSKGTKVFNQSVTALKAMFFPFNSEKIARSLANKDPTKQSNAYKGRVKLKLDTNIDYAFDLIKQSYESTL